MVKISKNMELHLGDANGSPTLADELERKGEEIVHIILSKKTVRHLQTLANHGIYGSGIEGVVEGFVYRGLQEVLGHK